MDFDSTNGSKRIFNRLGPSSGDNKTSNHNHQQQQKVCFYWRAGRCNRNPCNFLHRELPPPSSASTSFNGGGKRPHSFRGAGNDEGFSMRKNPNFNNTWGRVGGIAGGPPKKVETICNYWVQGSCSFGERCKFLHSCSIGDSFSLLTALEGHQKVVTGIALPSGKDKLYTGSKDEHVRIWDCQSGQRGLTSWVNLSC